MRYRESRQNDGTYNIESSQHGGNWEIVLTGVRGCNVSRIINRLYFEDNYPKEGKPPLSMSCSDFVLLEPGELEVNNPVG